MAAGVIGQGIAITGQLRAGEDLIVRGAIRGNISLTEHHLTLETTSNVEARLNVKEATLKGTLQGNSEASSKVTINTEAVVRGDIKTPVLVMEDGARFRGAIEMDVPLPPELLVPPHSGGGDRY